MEEAILLQVVSPERKLVDERVTDLQIPARDGYIGAAAGHAPLLSELKAGGILSYVAGGAATKLAVYGGFVEVLPDRVRVLADAAEFSTEIDAGKARERLAAAQKAAEKTPDPAADPDVLLDEIARAQAAVDAAVK